MAPLKDVPKDSPLLKPNKRKYNMSQGHAQNKGAMDFGNSRIFCCRLSFPLKQAHMRWAGATNPYSKASLNPINPQPKPLNHTTDGRVAGDTDYTEMCDEVGRGKTLKA